MYELLATTPEQRQLLRVVAPHRGILALNGKSPEGCLNRRVRAGDSVRNARGVRLVGRGGGWMGSGQLACMGAERLFYITPLCACSGAEGHNVCYVKIALGGVSRWRGRPCLLASGGLPRSPEGAREAGQGAGARGATAGRCRGRGAKRSGRRPHNGNSFIRCSAVSRTSPLSILFAIRSMSSIMTLRVCRL